MTDAHPSSDGAFVLAYFRTPAEALHLAWSLDGLRWTALNDNRPVLTAMVGNRSIRDPFIRRDAEGFFRLVSTDSWASRNLITARSRDLVEWEPQRLAPVMAGVEDAENAWAPEWVHDPDRGDYLVFWASVTTLEHHQRIWSARTPDFVTWSRPSVLFDPGYSVIDATLVPTPSSAGGCGGWTMIYKDERGRNAFDTDNKAMRVAHSAMLSGPYGDPSGLVTPRLTEGPAVFLANGRWLMLYDHFLEGKWGAAESSDLRTWRPVSEDLSVPEGARHGTVFSVTREELERLFRAWPS